MIHQGAQEIVGDDVGKELVPDHRRTERFENRHSKRDFQVVDEQLHIPTLLIEPPMSVALIVSGSSIVHAI